MNSMQDLVLPIGDFLVKAFDTLIVPAGNIPNNVFMLIGFVGLVYWIKLQGKFNKEAEAGKGLK